MLEYKDLFTFDYESSFSSKEELSDWLKEKLWKGENPRLKENDRENSQEAKRKRKAGAKK